ncbi:hypothetical protein NDU88_008320 [Pleurodeles waltl]|uniref:Uncharacterized protein n=1 Tax=Pleurodeles waltl TaxID=8319 RepID=A0AAV7N8G8_PLEWA|nr:hypothetical protein NDU88_008320 [Pleurodeles waltl]
MHHYKPARSLVALTEALRLSAWLRRALISGPSVHIRGYWLRNVNKDPLNNPSPLGRVSSMRTRMQHV